MTTGKLLRSMSCAILFTIFNFNFNIMLCNHAVRNINKIYDKHNVYTKHIYNLHVCLHRCTYVPVGLIIRLICSMFCSSGDSPPCMQNIFSSTIAATGKQLKQSVKVFHSLILYLLLPTFL